MSPLHEDTRAVHVSVPEPTGSAPLGVPIYQSHVFSFTDSATMAEAFRDTDGPFLYSRLGNPTTRALENAVADLEGAAAGFATASGMGAITAVLLSLLGTGDHVIAQRCLYGGSYAMLSDLAERWGLQVSYVSGEDPEEVRECLRPTTRLLYLETIANPTTQVADLPALIDVARRAGVMSVVDNTFATPLLCRPIEHGADMVVHSTTKYIGGHADIIGGVAVFADAELHHRAHQKMVELGVTADPFAAWLTLRGLQTLPLRVRRQCDTATQLATKLTEHPAIERVRYPALPDHPSHAVAKRLLSGCGGVLSFDLAGGRDAGAAFVDAVQVASMAPSLGDVKTLVLHPASSSHRQLSAEELHAAGIGEGTIRVAVGIEHPDDLWADLRQALDKVG